MDAAGDAVMVFGPGRRITYTNRAAEHMVGAQAGVLRGATLPDLVSAGVATFARNGKRWLSVHRILASALSGRSSRDGDTVFALANGAPGVFSWRVDPVRAGDEIVGTVLVARDMTALSDTAFEADPVPQFRMDADGRLTALNWGSRAIFGIVTSGRISRPLRDLVHPDDVADFDLLLGEFFAGRRDVLKAEVRFVRPGGRPIWCRVTLVTPRRRLLDEDCTFDRLVGVVEDISDRKQLEQDLLARNAELERLISTDVLTGLHNRRHMEARLRQEAGRVQRSGDQLSMLLLDIDRFKDVNDTYGHAAGDTVLRELAERLRANIRCEDMLARWSEDEGSVFCRWGGEEFLALLPETGLAAATRLAERLCDLVRSAPVVLETGEEIRVTTSVGVAAGIADGTDDLLRRADAALYAAKAAGRDRVLVHGAVPGAPPTSDAVR